jgi:hypothetical protein
MDKGLFWGALALIVSGVWSGVWAWYKPRKPRRARGPVAYAPRAAIEQGYRPTVSVGAGLREATQPAQVPIPASFAPAGGDAPKKTRRPAESKTRRPRRRAQKAPAKPRPAEPVRTEAPRPAAQADVTLTEPPIVAVAR